MRSINEIVIAVQECEPVTEEELRLAVAALGYMETMDQKTIHEFAELVAENKHKSSIQLKAQFLLQERGHRFKSMKMPVDQYLGAANIPGTIENKARRKMMKNIFKQATGIDL